MVPRAAADEKIRDGTMHGVVAAIPAGGPADDLQLVIVTVPDDVTARVGEPPHDVEVTGCRGPVHRVGVVSLLAGVHVEAALQQQVHHRQMSGVRRRVQQRPLVRLRASVQLVRVLVEQRVSVVDVAFPCRVEQLAVHRQRVDVRLERPPARKPVLLGQVELRVGQLRGRVRLAQLVETALGLLAEPIEVGVVGKGQRSGRRPRGLFGHETPSFLRKGANPFSRPLSAAWARNRRS